WVNGVPPLRRDLAAPALARVPFVARACSIARDAQVERSTMQVASLNVRRRISRYSARLAGPVALGFLAAALAGLASAAPAAASVDPLGDPFPSASSTSSPYSTEAPISMGAALSASDTPAHVRPKVVLVVGPTGSVTHRYRSIAHRLAVQARSY